MTSVLLTGGPVLHRGDEVEKEEVLLTPRMFSVPDIELLHGSPRPDRIHLGERLRVGIGSSPVRDRCTSVYIIRLNKSTVSSPRLFKQF